MGLERPDDEGVARAGEHLVYNHFGRDLLELVDGIGFATDPIRFESTSETASSQVAFCSVRPAH